MDFRDAEPLTEGWFGFRTTLSRTRITNFRYECLPPHKYWKVESESPDYKVTFQGDTAEILSPKGLTLWRKEKMSGRVTIEYDACVVVEKEGDRLSDLNCFWMASDPKHPDNIYGNVRSGVAESF